MKATPPEEKRRRQRALEKAEAEEVYVLDLKPFCQIPKVEFNNVKLGDVAVRKLLVRNTSSKVMQVLFDTYITQAFFSITLLPYTTFMFRYIEFSRKFDEFFWENLVVF